MEETPPTICPMCSSPISERSGMSKKTNKPYHFFGCSNYPTCNYIWNPKGESKRAPLKEGDQGTKILKNQEDIKAGIKVINENIKILIGFKDDN